MGHSGVRALYGGHPGGGRVPRAGANRATAVLVQVARTARLAEPSKQSLFRVLEK